ncbi:MAG: type II toxin-antitoxin system RelE/ParE family toxin [Planctomycetota bacterium]
MPGQDAGDSSEFRIFETDEFRKRFDKLPARESRFLRRKLTDYVYPQLRNDPFLGPNIKKLRGYEPDTWRYRIGRFRLFFVVDGTGQIVYILSVDDRRDAYR